MSTQVMTRKELILLLALERMIKLAVDQCWSFTDDELSDALTDAQEAVRIARLDQ